MAHAGGPRSRSLFSCLSSWASASDPSFPSHHLRPPLPPQVLSTEIGAGGGLVLQGPCGCSWEVASDGAGTLLREGVPLGSKCVACDRSRLDTKQWQDNAASGRLGSQHKPKMPLVPQPSQTKAPTAKASVFLLFLQSLRGGGRKGCILLKGVLLPSGAQRSGFESALQQTHQRQ